MVGSSLLDLIGNTPLVELRRLSPPGRAIYAKLEGQLRYANVYVDGEDIRTLDELETPVRDGSTVILLPAMAGGC